MRNHSTLVISLVCSAACHGHADDTRSTMEPPIRLAHQVIVQGGDGSISHALQPRGDVISNGDRVYVSVTPEESVFLYLGYCDRRTFKLYPEPESDVLVRAAAGSTTRIPEAVGLGIEGSTEFEIIYLIASRMSLAHAKADLQVKLAESRGTPDGDCSGSTNVPPQRSVDVRSSGSIRVERYQLKRQPPRTAP